MIDECGGKFGLRLLLPGDPEGPAVDRRIERQRIAGNERGRRTIDVDFGRTLSCIFLRQQTFGRHSDEILVRVVAVTIGIGEFQGLDQEMHVVGAIVAHRLKIEGLEDIQRLQQHRPLAVERLLVNGVAAVIRHRRLFDARVELGEIRQVEAGTVFLEIGDHLPGDIACVETIARGDDGRFPALARVRSFRFHHAPVGIGESGQFDGLSGPIKGPVRLQPGAPVVRPLIDKVDFSPNRAGSPVAHRESLFRVLDRALCYLFE